MTENKKNLNKIIDDLLKDLNIPSDKEIRTETGIIRRELNGWKSKNELRLQDSEYKKKVGEKVSVARKGIKFTDDHRKNIGNAAKGRTPHNKGKITSETTKDKQKIAHIGAKAPNKKPVITPSGAFASAMEAGKWAENRGLINAYKKLQGYLTTNIDPDNFRYITNEEYKSLNDFPWKNPDHIPDWFPSSKRFKPIRYQTMAFETLKDLTIFLKNQGMTNINKKIKKMMENNIVEYITKQEFYSLKKNSQNNLST